MTTRYGGDLATPIPITARPQDCSSSVAKAFESTVGWRVTIVATPVPSWMRLVLLAHAVRLAKASRKIDCESATQ